MTKKIVVSGSIAEDVLMFFDGNFPDYFSGDMQTLSVCFLLSDVKKFPGGTGHNAAYTLGLLGAKNRTILLGAVGEEYVPDQRLSLHVSYDYVINIPKVRTAGAYVMTDANNRQITGFYPGAMNFAHLQNLPAGDIASVLVLPNGKQAMLTHLLQAYQRGIPAFFVPGQQLPVFTPQDFDTIFSCKPHLICNEYEFTMLLQKTNLTIDTIVRFIPSLLVTQGEKGATMYFFDKGNLQHISCKGVSLPSEKVVDPTGAGDAFAAAYVRAYTQQYSTYESLELANVVASFVVEHKGTMMHMFSWEDVVQRYEQTYAKKVSKSKVRGEI